MCLLNFFKETISLSDAIRLSIHEFGLIQKGLFQFGRVGSSRFWENLNGKADWAKSIGLENVKGWGIRNRYWKGCTGQGISHYRNRSDHLCLFERIFDLLSYNKRINTQRKKSGNATGS